MKMLKVFLTVLPAVTATVAGAQDLQFSIIHTEACLQEAVGASEERACVGASAEYCMEASPYGFTTVGIGGCLDFELSYWDERLNRSYRALRSMEAAADADYDAPVKRVDALRDMQRAWITFRDATCDYERAQWGGGTGGGPATGACLMRMTGEQTLYLEHSMAGN